MNFVTEIYKTARNQPVELSLENDIQIRKDAEQRIYTEVNKLSELDLIDKIAMILPIVVAPIKNPNYFAELFGGPAGNLHADSFGKIGLPEFADIQRLAQVIFGVNPKQKFLFSLKQDPNSPVALSVNKVLLLINATEMKDLKPEINRLLGTIGIPDGYSVSELFKDTLEYNNESPTFDQTLTSHLLNTFILTTLAAKEPKVFKEEFNYKISKHSGRSTYKPDEGEVLFEVSQTDEVPAVWFEIFDKVDDESFDLNYELASQIEANLLKLAEAV